MATSTTMAAGGGDGDRKSASDCSICLEKFSNPKMLPCGHSFCESCLLPLIKSGRLECPRCRKPADEPSDGFPTNFDLLQLLEDQIEDESENKALGRIEVSQSLLAVNREQYERAREKLIATLQVFKSPEIGMVRERHQECKELIMATNESITKFFEDLSDETAAIEAWVASTFESLTISNSFDRLKLFIGLPSFFDDKRFERAFTSVQRKVSNLEQMLRRAADIDEESYEMEEPRNRGNGISSNAAPSNDPPQSAAASSSASNGHQVTSGSREPWFSEQIVIDNKHTGFILGKYGARKLAMQDKYRCQIQFQTSCDFCLFTIRGRDARLVTAAKTEIQSLIEVHKTLPPCSACNGKWHIARTCPRRSMIPKDSHGDSAVRSVRGRSSDIAGPSSSQTVGLGQTSRSNTSNEGGYGDGDGLPPGFGDDDQSMANSEHGRLSLDDDE